MHPTGIVAPHLTLTTYHADITHATIPWTGASLTSSTPNALHRKCRQLGKPSLAQDLQAPIIPTFRDCCYPGSPIRFILRFRQLHQSFKILEPSPSTDKDEWGAIFRHQLHHRTCLRLPYSDMILKKKDQRL